MPQSLSEEDPAFSSRLNGVFEMDSIINPDNEKAEHTESQTPPSKVCEPLRLSAAPERVQSPLERDDWAENIPYTDHVHFFRSTNWSASILGPLKNWSLALRIHVFTIFAESRPSCIYWGEHKVAIYNEGFGMLAVLCSQGLDTFVY
jgi:hypothetical protein